MEGPLCPPAEPDFRLIETFGYLPGAGFVRLDRHLQRMALSAQTLGIAFDRQAAEALVHAAHADAAQRCRLTLDARGAFDLTLAPLAATQPSWRFGIAQERLDSSDRWLRHKTTRRALYDRVRRELPPGIDEMIFANERGEVCEGTITNIFVTTSDGSHVTPPLACGLLPGVLRQSLLEQGAYCEDVLTLQDLGRAQSVALGNSLRGLIPGRLAEG